MSQAFVKESEEQWLHDVPATMNALIVYLTRENNGIRVYEKSSHTNAAGNLIHNMSNGLSYYLDKDSKWEIDL